MEHYQTLFNALFAAAKVNNAFLEFRCQNNTVRIKWSDTDKPYTTKDINMPHRGSATFVDVSRPPPTAVQFPVGNRRERGGEEVRPTADQPKSNSNSKKTISPRMLRKRHKKKPYLKTSARSKSLTLLKQRVMTIRNLFLLITQC